MYVTSSVVTLLVIVLGIASMPARAQMPVCKAIEFAELESLPKEELLAMRCESVAIAMRQDLSPPGARQSDNCFAEVKRMDRILIRKYEVTGDEPRKQVGALCSKR